MASKKRTTSKASSARKKSARKASSKRGSKKSTARGTGAKRRTPKRPTAARAGLDSVRQAGEKTWETLKSTTAQVVEGVKDTLGGR